jgi:hypothetical protein
LECGEHRRFLFFFFSSGNKTKNAKAAMLAALHKKTKESQSGDARRTPHLP